MSNRLSTLEPGALHRALLLRDLTDPSRGPHALQLVLDALTCALSNAWSCKTLVHRSSPIVPVSDNYDRLRYPKDGAARDARYTRYLAEDLLLRTQTSAMIPGVLRVLAASTIDDLLVACPGLVYRRDAIDRVHLGESHQLDLWRLASRPLTRDDLGAMVGLVVEAALPGRRHRTTPVSHPYTREGLQIDVEHDGGWLEIGECGLAAPEVLADAGIDATRVSGLAMGLGLDRLLMIRKGLDDIRLLRSDDPRVASQLLDLAPYRPVSSRPSTRRDLSIAVDREDAAEDLGDRVREALGDRAGAVELVEILSETAYEALPEAARARLGIDASQKNLLVRVVLRDLDRTLTHDEANRLRDEVYEALHRGSVHQWAARMR